MQEDKFKKKQRRDVGGQVETQSMKKENKFQMGGDGARRDRRRERLWEDPKQMETAKGINFSTKAMRRNAEKKIEKSCSVERKTD